MSWSVGRPTVMVGDEVMGDSRTSVDLRDMRFLQVAVHNSSGCVGSFECAAEGRMPDGVAGSSGRPQRGA